MGARASRIVIDLLAGNTELIPVVRQANEEFSKFGQSAEAAGVRGKRALEQVGEGARHAVSDMQATSAFLRTFEGGFTNSLRAAERFVASIRGIGPIVQALFPAVGGVALFGVLDEMYQHATKLYDALKKLREGPEEMNQAFRDLNGPLQVANDQLRVTNDRLEAEIAKLQGKPVNGLIAALDDTKRAADELATSLNSDLDKVEKLLRERQAKGWEIGLSENGLGDLADQIKQFHQEVNATTGSTALQIQPSSSPGLLGIHLQPNTSDAGAALDREEQQLRQQYSQKVTDLQQQLPQPGTPKSLALDAGETANAIKGSIADLTVQFEQALGRIRNARDQLKLQPLQGTVDADKLTQPFEEKIHELDADLAGLSQKLAAIGRGNEFEQQAAAAEKAAKAIAQLNGELSRHPQLGVTGIPTNETSRTVISTARQYGVDPRIALAVAERESGVRQFNDQNKVVTSSAGALGVMQLMPQTARELNVNPYDTAQNIQGGIRYLAQLYTQYRDWTKALQAYNWGPQNVSRGIPVPEDVQKYASGVLSRSGSITPAGAAVTKLQLNPAEEQEIRSREEAIQNIEAETQWKTKLDQTNTSIEDRTHVLGLETAAVGQGYEAEREAIVQEQLFQALKKQGGQINDQKWLQQRHSANGPTHQEELNRTASLIRTEEDAKAQQQAATQLDQMRQRIELEDAVAAAEAHGAEAVRLATLQHDLATIAQDKDTASAQRLIATTSELASAEQKVKAEQFLAQSDQEIAATQRLTDAQVHGAEAVRQAQLQNRLAEIPRDVPKQYQQQEIQRVTQLSEAQRQQQVVTEATKSGLGYQNRIDEIDQEIAALNQEKAANGDNLAIEISLKQLEQERAKVWSEQVQIIGTARDGLRAYFSEMANGGVSAAETVHDAFKTTFDSLNESLEKLIAGQKVNWASFFEGISHSLVGPALKNLEANIAGHFFPQPPGSPQVPQQPGANQQQQQTGWRGMLAKATSIFNQPAIQHGLHPDEQHTTLGASNLPGLPHGASRDGQSAATALFVTTVRGDAATNPAPSAAALPPPSNPFSSFARPSTTESAAGNGALPQRTGESIVGTAANAGFALTRLASGLIQRDKPNPEEQQPGTSSDMLEFGGYRADGGTVDPTQAYMVGEKGRELFVPSTSGTIIPNHLLAQSSTSFHPDTHGIKITGQFPQPPASSQPFGATDAVSNLWQGFYNTNDVTSTPGVLQRYLSDVPTEEAAKASDAFRAGNYGSAAGHALESLPGEAFVKDIVSNQYQLGQRSEQEWKSGQYVSSVAHLGLSAIPLAGPNMVSITDQFLQGVHGSPADLFQSIGEVGGYLVAGAIPWAGLHKGIPGAYDTLKTTNDVELLHKQAATTPTVEIPHSNPIGGSSISSWLGAFLPSLPLTALPESAAPTSGSIATGATATQASLFAPPPATPSGTPTPRPDTYGIHLAQGNTPNASPISDALSRFAESALANINPIPSFKEWWHRPDEINKAMAALPVLDKQIAGEPLTPAEQRTLDAGWNARLTQAEDSAPLYSAPAMQALQQASKGDLAGAAGTLAGGYFLPALPAIHGMGPLGTEAASSFRSFLADESGGVSIADRAARAAASYKPSTQAKQLLADQSEVQLSKALGIPRTEGRLGTNAPFDLQNERYGIEVKTLLDNANDKLTMHPESRARKVEAAAEAGLEKLFTVAVDKRGPKAEYYYREGLGSFRLGSMLQAPSLRALKKALLEETGSVGAGSGRDVNPLVPESPAVAKALLYHGTSAPEFSKFQGDLAYLTSDPKEAQAFAQNPIIGGGRGSSEPKVYGVEATHGGSLNIDDRILDAFDNGDDIDETVANAAAEARKQGYRYLDFSHPSSYTQDDFQAKISLFPQDDLNIYRKWLVNSPDFGGFHMGGGTVSAGTTNVVGEGGSEMFSPGAFSTGGTGIGEMTSVSADPEQTREDMRQNFGGFRVAGGSVDSGKVHVVGEKGPELFVPQVDGTIIPHHKLGAFTSLLSMSGGGTQRGMASALGRLPWGGARAQGGDVENGNLYLTGENGMEVFMPADALANSSDDQFGQLKKLLGGNFTQQIAKGAQKLVQSDPASAKLPDLSPSSNALNQMADTDALANAKAAEQGRKPNAFDNTKGGTQIASEQLATTPAGNTWSTFLQFAQMGLSAAESYMRGGQSGSGNGGSTGLLSNVLKLFHQRPDADASDTGPANGTGDGVASGGLTAAQSGSPLSALGNANEPSSVNNWGDITDPRVTERGWRPDPSLPQYSLSADGTPVFRDDTLTRGGVTTGILAVGENPRPGDLSANEYGESIIGSSSVPSLAANSQSVKAGDFGPATSGLGGSGPFALPGAPAFDGGTGANNVQPSGSLPDLNVNQQYGPSGNVTGAWDTLSKIGKGPGINWASLGMGLAGVALGLLARIFEQGRPNHHFHPGSPYYIPNFNASLASGGEAIGGMTHLVGEKGPELFVPHADGTVIPNHQLNAFASAVNGGGTQAAAMSLSRLGETTSIDAGGYKRMEMQQLLRNLPSAVRLKDLLPFGGYRAAGGDVDPSQAYMVGEQGSEMWTPPTSGGRVVPHDALGGAASGAVYIDARGTDPAATEQHVRTAMQATGHASVKQSFKTFQEYHARRAQRMTSSQF